MPCFTRTGSAWTPLATRSSPCGSCSTTATPRPGNGHWERCPLFNPGPAVYQPTRRPRGLLGISQAAVVPAADRTLRPEWLRQAARQRLGTEPATIDACDCPHVSQPRILADILTALPNDTT